MVDILLGALFAYNVLKEDKREEAAERARKNAAAQSKLEEQQKILQQQMMEKNALARTNTLNELYAKMAICCYIAWADGVITPEERRNIDAIYLDIYNSFSNDAEVRDTLQRIYSIPHFNFINLEKYLRNTTPEAIASFLALADEIASTDGGSTDKERMCIYKIRKYLTERTGVNYTGINTNAAKADLRCPGCYATMEFQPHNGIAVCPYCGNIKHLISEPTIRQPASKRAKQGQNTGPQAAPPAGSFTFRCPICNSLLSAAYGTDKCLCARCRTRLSIRNGQATVW